jgi:hypothetical protein
MRAILIDKIDFPIPGEGNTANILLEYMSENEMQIRLGKALRIASWFLTDKISEISKKGVILCLWSGCLDAAKSVAMETLGGTTSPETRKEHFFQMDVFARWDSVYHAVVETVPEKTFNNNEKYNTAANTWTDDIPMPTPRHELAVIALNNDIYVIGGGPEPDISFANVNEIMNVPLSSNKTTN